MTRRRKDFLPPPQYICHLIAANPLEITIADDRPRGAFWNECPQFIFSLWVLISKRAGIPKGQRFLWLGVSNRGESTLLAVVSKGGSAALAGRIQRNRRFRGTRLFWKSLVCYTFGDRGWRKGVIRGGNKHFPSATEQAGSASSRTKSPGVCDSRIRLFGCR